MSSKFSTENIANRNVSALNSNYCYFCATTP